MEIEYDKNITIQFFLLCLGFQRKIAVYRNLISAAPIHIQVSLNINTKLLRLRAYLSDYS